MIKLYTRTGDSGETDCLCQRVNKDTSLIEVIGTIDELNSFLGQACSNSSIDQITHYLNEVQSDLFIIGAELSHLNSNIVISKEKTEHIEKIIDTATAATPALKNFILPGGTQLAAHLHVSRAICRRAERRYLNYAKNKNLNSNIQKYLNRLGDLLFALGRLANYLAETPEKIWKG